MQKILTEFKTGEQVRITKVVCGSKFRRRLSELGLFDEAVIEIIKNDQFGPLLLKIFDSKIALGRGEAGKIYAQKN